MTYDKNAVKKVLEWLKDNEPECRCDHCIYYHDKEKCHEEIERIKKKHIAWKEKVKKWEDRLNEE